MESTTRGALTPGLHLIVLVAATFACGTAPAPEAATAQDEAASSVDERRDPEAPAPDEGDDAPATKAAELAPIAVGLSRPVLADKVQPACIEQVRSAYRLMQKGKLPEARPLLEASLGECPHYAPAHYDLAVIHAAAGEIDLAVEALERALRGNYLRYATFMQTDEDLQPLRTSDRWAEVTSRAEGVRREYVEALSRPGVYALLGHDDPRAASIVDWEQRPLPYEIPEGMVGSLRGQLFFAPRGSDRLIPLSDRKVGGFIVDAARRKVHLWRWSRLQCSEDGANWEAWNALSHGQRKGVTLETLDLQTLSGSEPVRLPDHGYPDRRPLALCGDELLLLGRSSPETTELVATETTERVTAEGLSPFEGASPDPETCQSFESLPSRRTRLGVRLCERFSEDEQVCTERDLPTSPARRLLWAGPGGDEMIVEGPRVIQLEVPSARSLPPLPVDESAIAPDRGLTCESIGSPRLVKSARLDDGYCETRRIAIRGHHAFVASAYCGVTVWDIERPAAPRQVLAFSEGATVYSVAIRGRQLLIGDGAGLRTYDVANPLAALGFPGYPKLLGALHRDDGFIGRDVILRGDLAYVATGGEGLHLVDVSDLSSPRYLSKVARVGPAFHLTIDDGDLIVRAKNSYSRQPDRRVDLTDPAQPKLLGTIGRHGFRAEVRTGQHRLVATSRGLEVHDTSRPAKTLVSRLELPGASLDLALSGRHAFVVANPTWLHVVELCPAATEEVTPAE